MGRERFAPPSAKRAEPEVTDLLGQVTRGTIADITRRFAVEYFDKDGAERLTQCSDHATAFSVMSNAIRSGATLGTIAIDGPSPRTIVCMFNLAGF